MVIDKIALVLAIIGALNWGLIGFFNFNLVAWILAPVPGSAGLFMPWLESADCIS